VTKQVQIKISQEVRTVTVVSGKWRFIEAKNVQAATPPEKDHSHGNQGDHEGSVACLVRKRSPR
jgi:hypothetical protein